jgi:uncharacterized hydrophobic protein (TIGR00271 family)
VIIRKDGPVIHLRLIVPARLGPSVLDHLRGHRGAAHLVHLPGASLAPVGDVVLCDVAREAANEVVEWLQLQGVHREGAITIETTDAVVSDAAARADALAPGEGGDALIWEQLEARARAEATPTASFLVFIAVAAVIALIGILLDSPILIVGAMVVGPEYGPIAATCVALARRRARGASRAISALLVGLVVATVASFVATLLFRATGLAGDGFELTDRELTSFISHPDGLGAVVAVLAGVVGMLSLTQSRSGSLVGVLVSVTTIPAVANMGAAAAYGNWGELGGAAAQLAINVLGLLVAGVVTLLVQHRTTNRTQP